MFHRNGFNVWMALLITWQSSSEAVACWHDKISIHKLDAWCLRHPKHERATPATSEGNGANKGRALHLARMSQPWCKNDDPQNVQSSWIETKRTLVGQDEKKDYKRTHPFSKCLTENRLLHLAAKLHDHHGAKVDYPHPDATTHCKSQQRLSSTASELWEVLFCKGCKAATSIVTSECSNMQSLVKWVGFTSSYWDPMLLCRFIASIEPLTLIRTYVAGTMLL